MKEYFYSWDIAYPLEVEILFDDEWVSAEWYTIRIKQLYNCHTYPTIG